MISGIVSGVATGEGRVLRFARRLTMSCKRLLSITASPCSESNSSALLIGNSEREEQFTQEGKASCKT